MSMASDEAFTYLLIESYWDTWAAVDLEAYKIESTFENNSTKKKKRKATWRKFTKYAYEVQDILKVGQMKGDSNSIPSMRR